MRAVVPWQPRVGVFLLTAGNPRRTLGHCGPPLVTGPRQVGSSVRRAADVIGSAGPGRSRHFRGQTRYERRSRSPVESQSCSNGHLRSGEGAPSATADSHTAPEVKKWLAHKDPAPLAFALHPDLQLMAQPDRALVQGTERQTAPPWRVHQCRRPHRGDHRVGRTLEHRPEAVRMESHRGTDHHQSPTRTSKSDADVKPSTGLKLRRTTRPPGSHLGGPGLRRRHGELVALDDVREPFGLRHWDLVAVRELDELRHLCFAALGQVDDRPEELFESGR